MPETYRRLPCSSPATYADFFTWFLHQRLINTNKSGISDYYRRTMVIQMSFKTRLSSGRYLHEYWLFIGHINGPAQSCPDAYAPEFHLASGGPHFSRFCLWDLVWSLRRQLDIVQDSLDTDNILLYFARRTNQPILRIMSGGFKSRKQGFLPMSW